MQKTPLAASQKAESFQRSFFCALTHQIYPMSYAPHCASFPRHLGRQIRRGLIAHQTLDTNDLMDWSYGLGPHPHWHSHNVRRHLRMWGYRPVGRRNRRLLWQLPR